MGHHETRDADSGLGDTITLIEADLGASHANESHRWDGAKQWRFHSFFGLSLTQSPMPTARAGSPSKLQCTSKVCFACGWSAAISECSHDSFRLGHC